MFIKFLNRLLLVLVIGMLVLGISVLAFADEGDSILDRILKDKVMRVGVPPDVVNWSIVNPNTGKWEGISIDIMEYLAEGMGVKVEYKSVDWQVFPLELNAGSIDIFAGTAHFTIPRAIQVAYPHPVFWKATGFVTLTKNVEKFKSLEDINKKGVKIAVGIGTNEDQKAKYYYPNAEVLRMKTGAHTDLAAAVQAGQADLAAFGHLNAWDFSRKFDWCSMPIKPIEPSMQSFPIKYGDWKWYIFLNAYFQQISLSGLVDRIVSQWFPEMPDEIRNVSPY